MDSIHKRRHRSAAVVVIAVVVAALCGLLLYTLLMAAAAEPGVIGVVMAVYGLVVLAVLAGVIYAAVQRLREIRGGEEDEASQY